MSFSGIIIPRKSPHQFQCQTNDILDSAPEKMCEKAKQYTPAFLQHRAAMACVPERYFIQGKYSATAWREGSRVSRGTDLAGSSFQPALGQAQVGSTTSCQSSSPLTRWASAQLGGHSHCPQKAKQTLSTLCCPAAAACKANLCEEHKPVSSKGQVRVRRSWCKAELQDLSLAEPL